MPKPPRLSRAKLTGLGLALGLYLSGVLLLSAVSLREPKGGARAVTMSDGTLVHRNRGNNAQTVKIRRPPLRWCSALRYKDPWEAKPIALASFPGSGNTWIRYLLQQATGYHTGSVYKDFGLLKNGFPAESVHNTSVLAVKTHEWGPLARSAYSKAVLIIRGPAEAIKAEFNRQSGGHVGFASPGRYKRTKGKYWEQFVADKLWAWESFNMDWGRNFSGPLRIIFYEHLIKHVATELRELLNFLEVSVDEKLLACALDRQEGIYRRNRPKEPYDPYTEDMKRALAARKEVVYKELGGPLYSSDVNAYDTVKIHVHN